MSRVDSIVADVHAATAVLVAADDPAATRVAAALARWHAGDDFEAALGLPSDWRWRLRIAARDRALAELSRLRADLSDRQLATLITEHVSRHPADGPRPDGVPGYLHDLVRTGCPGWRHLRRLIAGHRAACDGPREMAASATEQTKWQRS
jgi:hypothetical protein